MESIAKTDVEQKLLDLCSADIEPKGYRIVDLDCRIGGRSLLRVFIERSGQTGLAANVGLEDCVAVSRALGELLETYSGIPGKFDLEVSSPGLDRRLRLRSDFEQCQGEEVQIKLVDKIEGLGGSLKGKLLKADSENVLVDLTGKEVALPWPRIKQANRIWKME